MEKIILKEADNSKLPDKYDRFERDGEALQYAGLNFIDNALHQRHIVLAVISSPKPANVGDIVILTPKWLKVSGLYKKLPPPFVHPLIVEVLEVIKSTSGFRERLSKALLCEKRGREITEPKLCGECPECSRRINRRDHE